MTEQIKIVDERHEDIIEDPIGSIFLTKIRTLAMRGLVSLSETVGHIEKPTTEEKREYLMRQFLSLRSEPSEILAELALVEPSRVAQNYQTLELSLWLGRGAFRSSRDDLMDLNGQQINETATAHNAAIEVARENPLRKRHKRLGLIALLGR